MHVKACERMLTIEQLPDPSPTEHAATYRFSCRRLDCRVAQEVPGGCLEWTEKSAKTVPLTHAAEIIDTIVRRGLCPEGFPLPLEVE